MSCNKQSTVQASQQDKTNHSDEDSKNARAPSSHSQQKEELAVRFPVAREQVLESLHES